MREARDGERNNVLFKETAGLSALIAGGELADGVLAHLREAAELVGLDNTEVYRTMYSAWTAGSRNPRRAPR